MSAWQIPLAVEHPTFGTSPQEAQSRMNLKSMAGAQAIQKQVQAENDLKLQAMQEDQSDQQTIQQAFQDSIGKDGQVDYDKVRAAVQPKIRIRNMQELEKMHNNLLQGTLKMDADKRAQLLAKNTTIGNELMGLLQTPQDQRQAAYAATRARLVQLGDIAPDDPNYPEQGAPLDDQSIKGHLAQVGYAAAVQKLADSQAQEEQRKSLADKNSALADKAAAEAKAKEIQQGIEDAARDHLKVTDQASHDDWWRALPADVQRRMPKTFDPVKTPEIIQNMALTAQQRATNLDRKAKIDEEMGKLAITGGIPAMILRANDPTLPAPVRDMYRKSANEAEAKLTRISKAGSGVQDRFDRTEIDKDRNRFQDIREKEVEQWGDVQTYEGAAQGKGNDQTITDPKNASKSITVRDAKSRAAAARSRAQELNSNGKQILQQHGWGEFAAGQQQAAGQPEPTLQPVAAPVAQQPPSRPASIPATAKARYSPSKKQWQYSTDGGMTWVAAPTQ